METATSAKGRVASEGDVGGGCRPLIEGVGEATGVGDSIRTLWVLLDLLGILIPPTDLQMPRGITSASVVALVS